MLHCPTCAIGPDAVETANRGRHGLEPFTAAAAELLAGLVRCPRRGAQRGERGPAFRAEAVLGAVVVVAGRATHGVSSRPQCLPHLAQMSASTAVLQRRHEETRSTGPVVPPSTYCVPAGQPWAGGVGHPVTATRRLVDLLRGGRSLVDRVLDQLGQCTVPAHRPTLLCGPPSCPTGSRPRGSVTSHASWLAYG